jgi:hypothetical protein
MRPNDRQFLDGAMQGNGIVYFVLGCQNPRGRKKEIRSTAVVPLSVLKYPYSVWRSSMDTSSVSSDHGHRSKQEGWLLCCAVSPRDTTVYVDQPK